MEFHDASRVVQAAKLYTADPELERQFARATRYLQKPSYPVQDIHPKGEEL
jgi:hypothetical protein